MSFEKRIKELNIILPKAANPVGSYVATKKAGKILFISGQISMTESGELIKGKIGRDLSFYERFDTIGLNYRMNEISAAVGLGQLDRLDEIIAKRKACGALFEEAVADCSFMIPQFISDDYESSYYTFAVRYLGEELYGVSWQDFYQRYMELGGDGFYGACQVPYLEPVFKDKANYTPGLAPQAEAIQRQLMQFKTNYRDLDKAASKIILLKELLKKIEK